MTKRPNSEAMDTEIGREHKVLDKGFIRVVDYMGDDGAIVQAARVSYGTGTETPSSDRSLIRYLMSHRHTTPFEMCEIKLHVKLPVFVARQWIRHRTASVNEYSARYSILANEFYIPEARDVQPQSKANKQGRVGGFRGTDVAFAMVETIRQHSEGSYQLYEELHTGWPWFDPQGTPWEDYEVEDAQRLLGPHEEGHGMAREMARMTLPVNVYTEWYWKVDLHNLLHFLSLRADPHAQMEIRAYADVICSMVQTWCPEAFAAFEEYVMGAVKFSATEAEALRKLVSSATVKDTVEVLAGADISGRERSEFLTKLGIAK